MLWSARVLMAAHLRQILGQALQCRLNDHHLQRSLDRLQVRKKALKATNWHEHTLTQRKTGFKTLKEKKL